MLAAAGGSDDYDNDCVVFLFVSDDDDNDCAGMMVAFRFFRTVYATKCNTYHLH